MDRRELEIALAYAVREREASVGRGMVYSRQEYEAGVVDSEIVTIEPVVPTPRPEWLQDGCKILPPDGGLFCPAYMVHIGNDLVCLISKEGSAIKPYAVDTAVLVKRWRPFPTATIARL